MFARIRMINGQPHIEFFKLNGRGRIRQAMFTLKNYIARY